MVWSRIVLSCADLVPCLLSSRNALYRMTRPQTPLRLHATSAKALRRGGQRQDYEPEGRRCCCITLPTTARILLVNPQHSFR